MVRDEIVRATEESVATCRTFSTANSKQTISRLPGLLNNALKSAITIEDVQKSVSGMEHAFLSGQRSPSNRDLKKLIKHDHDVIEMVTRSRQCSQ